MHIFKKSLAFKFTTQVISLVITQFFLYVFDDSFWMVTIVLIAPLTSTTCNCHKTL